MNRRRLWTMIVVAGLAAGCAASPLATTSGSSSAPPSEFATVRPSNGTFPTRVAGLPVVSVARADELLRSGGLNGQAVAVAGYYDEVDPPCAFPGRYIGPLETWCRLTAFADTPAAARVCFSDGGNGMSCGAPSAVHLAPFFMDETSGEASPWLSEGPTGEPAQLVLIGHAGDPRQWSCTATTQAECANAFVVDRIAWAGGQEVPLAAPQTGDLQSGTPIAPRLTLAQAAAAAGLDDNVVAGAAFRAGGIAAIDPRWTLAGDNLVWLVRSLASGTTTQGVETRPETVWLVDDATGRVIDSHPLKLDAAYQPARLWQAATVHGYDCCAGNLEVFTRVVSDNGTVVYAGLVSGSASGGSGATTFGGGYGSPPLVLPAGGYTITDWLADDVDGVMGAARDACSAQITLRPLDDVTISADFPAGRACAFAPAPSPSP